MHIDILNFLTKIVISQLMLGFDPIYKHKKQNKVKLLILSLGEKTGDNQTVSNIVDSLNLPRFLSQPCCDYSSQLRYVSALFASWSWIDVKF